MERVILGILSDTHGKADAARAAVKLLVNNGAEFLIHCGDVGSEAVLDQLAGHPSVFVFGNNDWDRPQLSRYASAIGVTCGDDEKRLTLDGKQIIVTHGDDPRIMRRAMNDPTLDYLFVGHTHQTMDIREGNVRIINPGALYRASVKTVAVLNLATGDLQFLPVTI